MLPTSTIRRIKRIEPIQAGKISGILYGIMGLLFIPFFLLISALTALSPDESASGMAFGLGFTLFLPIFYAIIGFIFGALGALIYNFVAGWIGGIEVEVE